LLFFYPFPVSPLISFDSSIVPPPPVLLKCGFPETNFFLRFPLRDLPLVSNVEFITALPPDLLVMGFFSVDFLCRSAPDFDALQLFYLQKFSLA